MKKSKNLILIGDSSFAEIAYEYFQYDSDYSVIAFSVERDYITKNEINNIPVIPFETIHEKFVPSKTYFYTAIVYTQLNRLRTRLYHEAKNKGFIPASYISPKAFIWRNVTIGEHVFIFEENTIQPFVQIGDNVVLWSGNHIGHHSIINNNVFISSHVVVSGHCEIKENCFLGVNATFGNNVTIAKDCLIGAGVTLIKNVTQEDSLLPAPATKLIDGLSAKKYFKVRE